MNALSPVSPLIPLIPENAPFPPAQRAWLNGFLAGLYGAPGSASPAPAMAPEPEHYPWHDPALELTERMSLAEGRPWRQKLMAAMGQLDCGQCGYLCKSYADALADGTEAATSLCVPGAKATSKLLKQLMAEAPAAGPAVAVAAAPVAAVATPAKPLGRPVRIAAAERLTTDASSKDVRHVVIELGESGLAYEPGDSIGLAAPNDPALVDATLTALGASGNEPVRCPDGTTRPVREAFTTLLDIARPLDRTTDLLAMSAHNPKEAAALRRLSDGDDGAEPADADLLDLLEAFPSARPHLTDLVGSLPTLRPRLYSIASSLRAAPGHVHLCMAVVRETRRGRVRFGVGSGFLAHRAITAPPIDAYIQTSHFRLPADPAVPVIMVGPGTGIAPFRAFLSERAAAGHRGRTWLFFGERNHASDFLYEPELRAWQADGTLSRLETAFSRDQGKKVYVQDRIAENAADVWRWLQDGAHFYVCGDASRMAKDVDAALRRVAMTQGGLDEAQARDWMVALARQDRYLRDVY